MSSFFSFLWSSQPESSESESSESDSSESSSQDDSSEKPSRPERHGERWTKEEEEKLITLKTATEDHSIEDIARELKRSKKAVRYRLTKVENDFWTMSRTRELVGTAVSQTGIKEVAQDLGFPLQFVENRMRELDLIGDTPLAKLRDRLVDTTVRVRFWKFEDGDFGNGTPSDCDAAWVPSKDFGAHEKDLYLFSEAEASQIAQLFVECYSFKGQVSRSKSGRTWNIWNVPQDRFKRKYKASKSKGSGNQSSSRSRRRKVDSQTMSRYRNKHPELKHMDSPEKWVHLSEQLMIDPKVLKSNLD